MGGGFLTIEIVQEQQAIVYHFVFWKFLLQGQGCDEGGLSRDRGISPLEKPCCLSCFSLADLS